MAVFVYIRVPWPVFSLYAYTAISFWNFNPQLLALNCFNVWPMMPFYLPFLLPLLWQPVVLFSAALTWALEKYQPMDTQLGFRASQVSRKLRPAGTRSLFQFSSEFVAQLVAYNVDALSLSFVPVVVQAFTPFMCQTLADGRVTMLMQPSVECWTTHPDWLVQYVLPALSFGVVYLIGVPLLFGWLLHMRHNSVTLSFSLARSYYPFHFWWWGVLVLFETTLLIALVMLVPNWIAQLVLLSVFIVAMIGVRIMVSGRIHRARFILHVMATASPILYLLVLVAALVAGLVSNEASSIVIVTVLAAAAAGLFGIAAIVSFILRRRSVLYGNEMADELYYVVDGQTSGIRSVLIGMCGILREKTSSLTYLVTCSLAHSLTRVR